MGTAFLFLALFFFIISSNLISLYAQDENRAALYPMQIGNKWQYEYNLFGGTYLIEITGDTLMPNGYNYFILKNSDIAHFPSSSFRYQRFSDSLEVFQYVNDSTEKLLYSLNANTGDSWHEIESDSQNWVREVIQTRFNADSTIDLMWTSVGFLDTDSGGIIDDYATFYLLSGVGYTGSYTRDVITNENITAAFVDGVHLFGIFANADTDTVVNYFPLNVGDWSLFAEYRVIDNIYLGDTTFVFDTLDLFGNTYWSMWGSQIYSGYFRTDENGNVFTLSNDSTESIIYKFDIAVGDTFAPDSNVYGSPHIQTMINKNTTAITPAGEFHNCIMIMTESTQHTDSEQFIWFAPNVGIVKTYLLAWDITLGLYSAKIGTTYYGDIVSIKEDAVSNLKSYLLMQNYPNPFNPMTKISYSLPRSSDVSIIIYNLIGEEVTRLVDGFQQAGEHTALWNASNISSGIYFYRLQVGDFVQTKKMVLLK